MPLPPPQPPRWPPAFARWCALSTTTRRDVDYAEEVRDAVWTALERLPDAAFDVVAVSPVEADPAAGTAGAQGEQGVWLHAEDVAASLMAMGIEPERLTLSAVVSEAARPDEVHLYIR